MKKKLKERMKKKLKNKIKEKEGEKYKRGVLQSYEIEVDKAKVKVEIKKETAAIIYYLYAPEIGLATASLLNEIRNELVTATTVSMKEIADPSAFKIIKKRFMDDAAKLVELNLPAINPDMKEFLIGKLMQDMLGLGEIEFLVNDPNLEE